MTPQQLWQADLAGAPPVTLEYVRYRMANLSQEATGKHWRVLVISGLVSLQLIWNLFHRYAEMPIMQVSSIYLYTVMWFNLLYWFKRTKVAAMPEDAGVHGSLQFYKRELERQRDMAKGTFARVVLLPLPGVIGLFASYLLERDPLRWLLVWFMGILLVSIAALVICTNLRHRRRFQKEIDAIDLLITGK